MIVMPCPLRPLFTALLVCILWPFTPPVSGQSTPLNQPAKQYLGMIENFAGFAEQHWNEKEEGYDAAGSGVTWARGNGGVCLVNAVLLTEYPERAEFSPKKIQRAV